MNNSINWNHTALVIVDPQVDLLSRESVIWDLVGEHVSSIDLVAKLKRLRSAAERAGIPVFYSRVEVTDEEYDSMAPLSGLQALMAERRMCVPGRGGRFHPELEPGEGTILLKPRNGPSSVHSDYAPQMRRRGIESVLFAGMLANLCVESHVRDSVEAGIAAYPIADAIGALGAESLEATLANFALHASGTPALECVLDELGALGAPQPA